MINKVKADIKSAMIEKNTVKKDVLKMVLDKANALAKESKTEVISDEMVLSSIKKEMKQLDQTIQSLITANKTDSALYTESLAKVDILSEYLPKQLSEDELKVEIAKFITDNKLDVANRGILMKNIMPVFKDKADGKLINKIISYL